MIHWLSPRDLSPSELEELARIRKDAEAGPPVGAATLNAPANKASTGVPAIPIPPTTMAESPASGYERALQTQMHAATSGVPALQEYSIEPTTAPNAAPPAGGRTRENPRGDGGAARRADDGTGPLDRALARATEEAEAATAARGGPPVGAMTRR